MISDPDWNMNFWVLDATVLACGWHACEIIQFNAPINPAIRSAHQGSVATRFGLIASAWSAHGPLWSPDQR